MSFGVVDRRYEREGPNMPVPTGNAPVINRNRSLAGDDAPLRAPDGTFDEASVFLMCGPSCRGAGRDAFSVEAVPSAAKPGRWDGEGQPTISCWRIGEPGLAGNRPETADPS